MRTLNMRCIFSFGMLLFAALLSASAACDEPASSTQRVSVDDVDRKLVLIGRLGHPLGTMVTLDGTWGYPDQSKGPTKDYSLEFTIQTVNGKPLARKLTLKTGAIHVIDRHGTNLVPPHKRHSELDGVSWSLRAYETGCYTVQPDEYWRFRGPIATMARPAFESSIVGFIPGKSGEQ